MSSSNPLPPVSAESALFLDVDGTLLELASHPDDVRAAPRLKVSLAHAAEILGGALALVSGRSIASLDQIFSPLVLPAAGLHGLERRDSAGLVHYAEAMASGLEEALHILRSFAGSAPGLLVEDKGAALALHYRGAPDHEEAAREAMERARLAADGDFHVQEGKMVLELKPAGRNKGTAVADFMGEPPFEGRRPIFAGDDVTDEDGFVAVNRMGGESIRVGPAARSAAGHHAAGVDEIIAWLDAAWEAGHDES